MKNVRSTVLHVALFLLAVASFLTIYIRANSSQDKYDRVELNTGWTVKLNNRDTYENVDLDDFHTKRVRRGDWFVLKSTIPDDIPDSPPFLA